MSLSIQEALALGLSEAMKEGLKKYPSHWHVGVDQNGRIHVWDQSKVDIQGDWMNETVIDLPDKRTKDDG